MSKQQLHLYLCLDTCVYSYSSPECIRDLMDVALLHFNPCLDVNV